MRPEVEEFAASEYGADPDADLVRSAGLIGKVSVLCAGVSTGSEMIAD